MMLKDCVNYKESAPNNENICNYKDPCSCVPFNSAIDQFERLTVEIDVEALSLAIWNNQDESSLLSYWNFDMCESIAKVIAANASKIIRIGKSE